MTAHANEWFVSTVFEATPRDCLGRSRSKAKSNALSNIDREMACLHLHLHPVCCASARVVAERLVHQRIICEVRICTYLLPWQGNVSRTKGHTAPLEPNMESKPVFVDASVCLLSKTGDVLTPPTEGPAYRCTPELEVDMHF